VFSLTVVALCLFIATNSQGKLFIDLNNPNLAKMNIAVQDFAADQPASLSGATLAQIIRNDLSLTGLFQIVQMPPSVLLNPAAQPDFDQLRAIGVRAVILGRLIASGGQLVLEAKLFDVDMGRLELGKRYTGRIGDHRLMVHRFGDRVMEALTSVPGCFSSKIAFVGAGQNRELFSMDFDGFNAGQLTHTKSIVLSPEWAADSRSILFTGYLNGTPDLWSLDLVTGQQRLISGRPGLNASARYSPRGDRIAVSLNFNGIPKIFMITPQGHIINRLTNGRGNDISPTWSPDESTIAYVSDHAGTPHIYMIPAHGGQPNRLTFATNYNTDPDWSPQGDLLAFTARIDGRFQVCTIRQDGTDFRVLTSQGSNQEPAWSPDGRMIAFSSNRRGKREVFLMDARGEIQVPVSPIPGKAPAWSQPSIR
jgi:TolB protein